MNKPDNNQQACLDVSEVDTEIIESSNKDADAEDADKAFLKWRKDEHWAFHWVKMGCIFIVPLIAVATALVFFFNLLGPKSWRWLTVEELSSIQSLVISIISGVATSLAVNYFYRSDK